jgi:hypothetical protein
MATKANLSDRTNGVAVAVSADYKKYAADCRAMARKATNEAHRQSFMSMAETWDRLAKGRAARVERQDQIRALDGDY